MINAIFFDIKLKFLLILAGFKKTIGLFIFKINIVKLKISLILGMVSVPFVELLNNFLLKVYGVAIGDETFIIIWGVAFFGDIVLGIWKHLKMGDFDFKELFVAICEKAVVSAFGMIFFNLLCSIKGIQKIEFMSNSLELGGQIACFIYVGGSGLKSCFYISKGKFPPIGFMRRMKNFEETFEIDKIIGKDENKPAEENPQP